MSLGKFGSILVVFLGLTMNSALAQAREILRVLAWPGYADADLVQVFEQQYKVDVEVTLVELDDTMWQRLTAQDGEKFDVFAVNTAQLQRYIDHGISVPLTPANIPNTAKQLPRFRQLSAIPGLTRADNAYAIPYTYSEMGLIYDRNEFPSPPESFSVLWDQRYQGQVLMYEGSEHNFTLAALVLGVANPFKIPESELKQVSRHLIELRRNVLTYYEHPEEATRLFIENHSALLFANYGSQQVTLLQKAGANIGYVIPKEGALAWLDCWSITRFAQNKALAEAWINYTLEPSVSMALTERQGLPNTLVNPPTLHKADKIIWLEQVEDTAKREALWEKIISGEVPEGF